MRHVDGTHKKEKNRDSTPTFELKKNSLGFQMRHVDGTHTKIKNRDSPPIFKDQKIP